MMRRFGHLFTAMLVTGFLGLLILMGCDRSLKTDNLISPTADVRITQIILPTGSILAPFVGAIQGTEATTPVTAIAYPDLTLRVDDFNGVSVSFNRFVVEYFLDDGITPAQVAPFRGFINVFLLGGYPSASDFSSIDPANTATGIKVGGITSRVEFRIPSITQDLQDLMAGPDHRFGTPDDRRDIITGIVTLFGEDINKHDIQISARFAITSRIPVVQQ